MTLLSVFLLLTISSHADNRASCTQEAVESDAKEACSHYEVTGTMRGDAHFQEVRRSCLAAFTRYFELRKLACDYKTEAQNFEARLYGRLNAQGGRSQGAADVPAGNLREHAERLSSLRAEARDFRTGWARRFRAKADEFQSAIAKYQRDFNSVRSAGVQSRLSVIGDACHSFEQRFRGCPHSQIPGLLAAAAAEHAYSSHFNRDVIEMYRRGKATAEALESDAGLQDQYRMLFSDQAESLESLRPRTGAATPQDLVGAEQDQNARRTPSYPNFKPNASKSPISNRTEDVRGMAEGVGKAAVSNDLEGMVLAVVRSLCGSIKKAELRIGCYLVDSGYVAARKELEEQRQHTAFTVNLLRRQPEITSAEKARQWQEFKRNEPRTARPPVVSPRDLAPRPDPGIIRN